LGVNKNRLLIKLMRMKKLPRILTSVFSTVISINFLVYAVQPYVPPSLIQHSASYSIVNCPSHSSQNSLSQIVQRIGKSEDDSGTEKQCYCFGRRSIQRSSFIVSKPAVNFLRNEHKVYLLQQDENPYSKDFYSYLSVRSPPTLLH